MIKRRRIYFDMKSPQEAIKILFHRFQGGELLSKETINVKNINGRISSEPVFARLSSPICHVAAMDGYSVKSAETFEASYNNPIVLRLNSQAKPVNTGQPLPPDMDAVIMIENVHTFENGDIEIREPVYPWQNVRKVGEDIVKTELLFPSFHKFTSYDVGALLTGGILKVNVYERPIVSIIPTGDELVSPEKISDDDIEKMVNFSKENAWGNVFVIDSNSAVIGAILEEMGCHVKICPVVRDDYEKIKDSILNETTGKSHIVIINAGSSSGTEDFTANAVDELGELLVHGVTMMPGKPSVIGIINGKPVFGTPGYPISAIISVEQLVIPFICHLLSQPLPERKKIDVKLSKRIPSKSGVTEFRRLVVGKVGQEFVATPLKKGAGSITTITKANAILEIPQNIEGYEAGEVVSVELLRGLSDVEKTILCIGSHDLTLDIIRDFLMTKTPNFNMISAHVGSLGGIIAIRDKMAHVAGSHLLDEETGDYNISFIKNYIPQSYPVRLFNLVYRIQGLIIQRNNPENIRDLNDLTKENIVFINRQRGSGTRVLLDYYLKKHGINPKKINGYENEETTHLAVAASVLNGRAHAGMGVLSAAKALGLDFIPIMEERYDLIIPEEFITKPMIISLLELINSEGFKKRIEELGGYSTRDTGKEFRIE